MFDLIIWEEFIVNPEVTQVTKSSGDVILNEFYKSLGHLELCSFAVVCKMCVALPSDLIGNLII